jgi:hypothetical protein
MIGYLKVINKNMVANYSEISMKDSIYLMAFYHNGAPSQYSLPQKMFPLVNIMP